MSARQRRFARACHEAGHVVTAHALSLTVAGISLDPDLAYAARIEGEIQKRVTGKQAMDLGRLHRKPKKAMTLLAGPVAHQSGIASLRCEFWRQYPTTRGRPRPISNT